MSNILNQKWRINKQKKILYVFGDNYTDDLLLIKKLIAKKTIKPEEFHTLLYRKSPNSVLVVMLRGKHLKEMLEDLRQPPQPKEQSKLIKNGPSFRDILNTINDAEYSKTVFAGVIIFCINTKRFLLFNNKQTELWGLMGDNPLHRRETLTGILCRVGPQYGLPLTEENLINQMEPATVDGVAYNTYLTFVEKEFQPSMPPHMDNSLWAPYKALEDIGLHPSIEAIFGCNEILQRLANPPKDTINYNKLIEEILGVEPEDVN